MDRLLFSRVNIPRANTHVPDGMAADLGAEAARYERLIREAGGIDFQLLGIGEAGHIGFNKPLSAQSPHRPENGQPHLVAQTIGPCWRSPEPWPGGGV